MTNSPSVTRVNFTYVSMLEREFFSLVLEESDAETNADELIRASLNLNFSVASQKERDGETEREGSAVGRIISER